MAGGGRTETHASIELVGFSLLRGVSAPQSLLFFVLRSWFEAQCSRFIRRDRHPQHFDDSAGHLL